MAEEVNEKKSKNIPEEEAGCIGLVCSFLFPLVGIILYFVKKKDVYNASSYLWAALGGMLVNICTRIAVH